MLPVRIIPCLDVRDGRVVKGVKFQGLKDQGDPAALARAYEEQAADEVVVLDVTATPEGRGTRLDTVAAVRARLSVPLTVGGGIGGIEDAAALLEAGADKVAVNTAATAATRSSCARGPSGSRATRWRGRASAWSAAPARSC